MKEEIQEMEIKVSKLTAEKEARMGWEVKTLSDEVDALSQDLVREVSVLSSKEDNLGIENENAEKTVNNIEDMKQSVKETDFAIRKAEGGAADLKKRAEEPSQTLNEYEKDYRAILAGKSNGNEDKCLEDQLGDAKVAVGSAETELKQLNTKISHCQREIKEKNKRLMSKREEADAVKSELTARQRDLENLENALKSVPYKEGQMEALQKDRASELGEVQKLRDEIRGFAERRHVQQCQRSFPNEIRGRSFDCSKDCCS